MMISWYNVSRDMMSKGNKKKNNFSQRGFSFNNFFIFSTGKSRSSIVSYQKKKTLYTNFHIVTNARGHASNDYDSTHKRAENQGQEAEN